MVPGYLMEDSASNSTDLDDTNDIDDTNDESKDLKLKFGECRPEYGFRFLRYNRKAVRDRVKKHIDEKVNEVLAADGRSRGSSEVSPSGSLSLLEISGSDDLDFSPHDDVVRDMNSRLGLNFNLETGGSESSSSSLSNDASDAQSHSDSDSLSYSTVTVTPGIILSTVTPGSSKTCTITQQCSVPCRGMGYAVFGQAGPGSGRVYAVRGGFERHYSRNDNNNMLWLPPDPDTGRVYAVRGGFEPRSLDSLSALSNSFTGESTSSSTESAESDTPVTVTDSHRIVADRVYRSYFVKQHPHQPFRGGESCALPMQNQEQMSFVRKELEMKCDFQKGQSSNYLLDGSQSVSGSEDADNANYELISESRWSGAVRNDSKDSSASDSKSVSACFEWAPCVQGLTSRVCGNGLTAARTAWGAGSTIGTATAKIKA